MLLYPVHRFHALVSSFANSSPAQCSPACSPTWAEDQWHTEVVSLVLSPIFSVCPKTSQRFQLSDLLLKKFSFFLMNTKLIQNSNITRLSYLPQSFRRTDRIFNYTCPIFMRFDFSIFSSLNGGSQPSPTSRPSSSIPPPPPISPPPRPLSSYFFIVYFFFPVHSHTHLTSKFKEVGVGTCSFHLVFPDLLQFFFHHDPLKSERSSPRLFCPIGPSVTLANSLFLNQVPLIPEI